MRSGSVAARLAAILMACIPAVPPSVQAQSTGQIAGVVTTETGQPISGASVVVVGTRIGALTDAGGHYTLTGVQPGQRSVQASMIGYGSQTQEVTVAAGSPTSADFQLRAQAVELEGIVAVGYGTTRNQDVTGSVSSVEMNDAETVPVAGPDQLLTAQVPGVEVITPTGAPGGGAQVRVRGVTAVGAGGVPLYVVDGFPITGGNANSQYGFMTRNPLNDIPPGDIESITVLKDASAAAIYGSRAANGVVIITTKKGKSGSRPAVDFTAYGGMQYLNPREIPDLANAQEFALFQKRVYEGRIADGFNTTVPEEYQNPSQYGEGTNWFEEVTRPAPTYNVQASFSGGSDRLRSYFSAGYMKQEGIVLNSGYSRLNLRANLDADLTDRLQVGLNLAPSYSMRNLAETGGTGRGGGFGATGIASPLISPRDENGNLRPMIKSPGTWAIPNPIIVLQERDHQHKTLRALGTAFANYELADGVSLRSSMNVDWGDNDIYDFVPSVIGGTNNPPPRIPRGSYGTSTFLSWLNENTFNVDREIGEAHRLQGVAGFTIQREQSTFGSFFGSNFPDDDIRTLNAAGVITGSTGEEMWSMMSYLARVNYTLLDRYVLTATVRTDGSSRFGANNRWGTFPSMAVAWNASQEDFLSDVTWLDNLKVRASLGFTGNNQIGNYSHLGRVVREDYVLGGSRAAGRRLASLQNPDLGWERTREMNFGVDASFLAGRLALTADVYQRNTRDLLLDLELPTTSGFGQVVENRGHIRNRGLEVALNSINIDRDNFRWSSNVNVSINRNTTLALGENDEPLRTGRSYEGSPTHITMVGYPVGLFYGYVIEGIYASEEDLENYPAFPGAVVGNLRYRDVNGDGVISRGFSDFAIIGNPYPDFTFGLTNNVSMGRFDLRVVTDGAVGGERILLSNASFENIDGLFNVSKEYLENMWVSPEQPGDGKTPTVRGSGNARVMFRDISDRWVSDASYFWVRNVTLRYNLPQGWLSQNSRSASLYMGLQNAFLFSPYNGNPQTSMSSPRGGDSPSLTPGVDHFSYPVPRTITLGIDLSF